MVPQVIQYALLGIATLLLVIGVFFVVQRKKKGGRASVQALVLIAAAGAIFAVAGLSAGVVAGDPADGSKTQSFERQSTTTYDLVDIVSLTGADEVTFSYRDGRGVEKVSVSPDKVTIKAVPSDARQLVDVIVSQHVVGLTRPDGSTEENVSSEDRTYTVRAHVPGTS